MTTARKSPGLTTLLICAVLFTMGAYFTFAAVQGDFGLFKRAEVDAEAIQLTKELSKLEEQIAVLENKTKRLSDDFLDLDLLDEQARNVLGLMRTDEIVVQ